MSRPYASLPEQLAGILTAQILPAGFDPARHQPNGTGPFRYTSFTPGQRSVFARNPGYWQHGLPYVDTLTIVDFPDTVSLQDALITGQVHAAGTLEGPQMATLANTSGVHPVASRAGTIIPFTMRVDQAPFSDVRVRQALRLIVDRPQLIDTALDGYGWRASDVFSPYDPDFDHALRRQADLPQAKFLLRKAGREDLAVTLVTAPIATGTVAMATVLAQQARAAGVTIKVQQVPPGTFFGPGYLKWTFSQDLPGSPGALLHRSPLRTAHARSRARGPSKPLGRFRPSAASRWFPPAGCLSSGGRLRVRGVSVCCVRRRACRGGPGSPP
jgi:peptide/nickel transport system substrate-binding protein